MRNRIFIIATVLLACMATSCSRSTMPQGGGKGKRAQAAAYSEILGFRISHKDDLVLYGEIVSWMGTPYRYGGSNRSGVDCSGFVRGVYSNAYGITLNRSANGIYENDIQKMGKGRLQDGDLVFFQFGKEKKMSHVGIYLKDDYFVHASTSRGVIVSKLTDDYYKKGWRKSGRVTKRR